VEHCGGHKCGVAPKLRIRQRGGERKKKGDERKNEAGYAGVRPGRKGKGREKKNKTNHPRPKRKNVVIKEKKNIPPYRISQSRCKKKGRKGGRFSKIVPAYGKGMKVEHSPGGRSVDL